MLGMKSRMSIYKKMLLNGSKLIQRSVIYFLITSTCFLFIPIDMIPEINERLQMIIFVLLCYFTFYYSISNISYKGIITIRIKKAINLQLHLLLSLSTICLFVNIIIALFNNKNLTIYLLLSNIPLGIINGALKNKRMLIYKINKTSKQKNSH